MSNSSKRSSLVAHVEDAADEDAVEGIMSTRKYAMSEALAKERPNTGKSRADKRHALSRSTSSSTGAGLTDSDSTARSSEKRGKEIRRPSGRDIVEAPVGDREGEREREREQRRRERRAREDQAPPRRIIRGESSAPARERDAGAAAKKTRPPPSKHSHSMPVVQQQPGYVRGRVEDPAFYGIKQPAASSSRPRAQSRPVSYYAGQPSGPRIVAPGWHPPVQSPGAPPFAVGSYPHPSPMWPGGGAPSPYGPPPPPSPMGPPSGYADPPFGSSPHSRLRNRFETRPSSAMGFRGPAALDYRPDDPKDEPAPRMTRRPSRSKRAEEDSMRMPPPSFVPKRPQSAVPPTTPFRPPPAQRPPSRQNHSRPPPAHRRSVTYDDLRCESPSSSSSSSSSSVADEDESLFHDISPNASYEQRRAVVARQRRSSVMYEGAEYDLVPAAGRGRRSSMYSAGPLAFGGGSLRESRLENKLQAARQYQEEVSGGSQVPLTAETLRKVMKRGGVPSSHSTRSSGSRDESEYRRSNTTGITRSSYGNEEFTIKVPGNAVVRLQGAEIECSNEGGEISWSSRPGGSRSGSDMASTVYQQIDDARRIGDGRHSEDSRRFEDPPMRMERKALPHRPRAPSQADSQSRGYAPTYAPYEPTYAGGDYI
ncbi:hypothetical protein HIM_02925 [Hirsutella minnesotensis 3608]|nr:hypothetical protein HIM_02925 [Hirsutella minnesotensis 3608]